MSVSLRTALVLGTLIATSGCNGSQGPIDGQRAFARVKTMVDEFGVRPAGSENLRKNAKYLEAELEKLGLPAHEQVWEEQVDRYGKPIKLTLRNVWTEIPGRDPEHGPILLLAAHYDSKSCQDHPVPEHNFRFVAAIDGAGGSAVLLELAGALAKRQNVPNIWIAWFDGEECVEYDWSDDKALLGSRHFANTMQADKSRFPKGLAARMRCMVLLDLIGSRNMKIDRDTRSNSTLLDIFGRAAAEIGESERMYRFMSPMTDDHIPFKNLGVPVIDLIDFRFRYPKDRFMPADTPQRKADRGPAPAEGEFTAWWHTAQDTPEQMDPASLAFTGNLVWQALPAIESHFFQP